MSDVSTNLKHVRKEAMGMLETIEKVRGRKYAASVHSLLLIQQIAKLTSFATHELDGPRPELAATLRHAVPEILTQLGMAVARITDFGEEHWKDIVGDVESIDESVDRLAHSAIDAARSGKEFGER